jgi:beta-ureidopropionase / N-carbamoyl-L-amino-acid hydrolase
VTFASMWKDLASIGHCAETGGYRRAGWTPAERQAMAWFLDECHSRNLNVDTDSIGNVVAWWNPHPGQRAPGVVTGSHLDSVPDGGAFDGPLGVVSALAAIDQLRGHGVVPQRPIGVAVFVEEEGSRFGLPCLGSRLATGTLPVSHALSLRDASGVSLPQALDQAGVPHNAASFGQSHLPAVMSTFVELHVEQGRCLDETDAAVGVATAIWPHGRWRWDIDGRADHAGTTRMTDRRDPMQTYAALVLAAADRARALDARATVGRIEVRPGATNAVPSRVRAWVDARASDEATLSTLVGELEELSIARAAVDGTSVMVTAESVSPLVRFDGDLANRLAYVIGGHDHPAPQLPTAAGHDAGVLAAAGVPSAMLFVRNPTGVSHSPHEHADLEDCEAGVEALAAVLTELATA